MSPVPVLALSNGQPFPVLGFGTMVDPDQLHLVSEAVYQAIVAGYRHIDTAWLYQNEQQVGQGIRRALDEGLVTRDEIVIVSKVWPNNYTRDRLKKSALQSNQDLGLGHLDLLLLHFPVPMQDLPMDQWVDDFPVTPDGRIAFDDSIDIFNETWKAMEELVDSGTVKSIGVSNFPCALLENLIQRSRIKPVVNQVESHPLLPRQKMLTFCNKHSIIMTAYSPFGGSPIRSEDGSVEESDVRQRLFQSEIVRELAAKYNKTSAQILLRFHVDRGVAVIPKSVTKSRMIENMQIFDFQLLPDELQSLTDMEDKDWKPPIEGLEKSKYFPYTD